MRFTHTLKILAATPLMSVGQLASHPKENAFATPLGDYVHLNLGHRFHALLKVCSGHDDTVPLIHHFGDGHDRYNKSIRYSFVLCLTYFYHTTHRRRYNPRWRRQC